MICLEIRNKFLNFFKNHHHKIFESSSLLPNDDFTLLFTNAGMVQFKDFFTGNKTSPYPKIATCQKCLRISGKHNDIENIGKTSYHHTFFEMLGNFSFGDYFKKEAINLSWEFLTKEMKILPKKLWISVYDEDEETYNIWLDEIKIPYFKIIKLKDNFWEMANIGPCGPCSEIIFDYGEKTGCGKASCNIKCTCGRFLELWNLVFMEYNRTKDGKLHKLPHKNVDTGMSLERLASIIQQVKSNFEIDIIKPIIIQIAEMSKVQYEKNKEVDISLRIIADHLKAVCFAISDGIIPSNQKRGYVLRKLLRRAIKYGFSLGLKEPFLYKLVDLIVDLMKKSYPILNSQKENITYIILEEEKKFASTLKKGLIVLENLLKNSKNLNESILSGKEIFKLYDTYGLPFDKIKEISYRNGFSLNEAEFEKIMQKQKNKGEKDTFNKISSLLENLSCYKNIKNHSIFKGYSFLSFTTIILQIIKDKKIVPFAQENDEVEIILKETPFYAEAGGQIGDIGELINPNTEIQIFKTKKYKNIILHCGRIIKGRIKEKDIIIANVSVEKRKAISRNHTATHLLHSILKRVLGEHVQQVGSLVSFDKLRFDFSHFTKVTTEELEKIEYLVNEEIRKNEKIECFITDLNTAKEMKALALFEEKYENEVRVVKIDKISLELCAGTHVNFTSEIGLFKIIQETGIAFGRRRIEALTGILAYKFFKEKETIIEEIAKILKTTPSEIVKKVKELADLSLEQEKEIKQLQLQERKTISKKLLDNIEEIRTIKLITYKLQDYNMVSLRLITDSVIEQIKSGIIILASIKNNQAFFVCKVTKDLTYKFHAGKIIEEITKLCEGKGGGKENLGQGGSKNISRVDFALKSAKKIIMHF